MPAKATWLDRTISFFAPRTGLKRLRARVATDQLARHYEAASVGRRTQGWRRNLGDSNAVVGPALAVLRDVARDLVRNNGYAESAVTTICDHVVGWGVVAKPKKKNAKAAELWNAWAGTTACDSDGRNDFYGLQKLAWRTVVESGEVLVRRRIRFPEDGLPIPMQLQVLDPDFIDTLQTRIITSSQGNVVGRIIHGIEFDILGRRAAYWLFPEHPGALTSATGTVSLTSRRIPAESILHMYKQQRPGQVRGPSWFAPVLLRFKDFDEFEDATLMKQKIAACLAVLTTNVNGEAPSFGTPGTTEVGSLAIDSLEPGMILPMPPGQDVTVVPPPQAADYPEFTKTSLRAIATGLGVTYEDLTGDYSDFNFSSARMSRLRHWSQVEDWRWRTLIPQFCDPVWAWAMQAAQIMGLQEAPAAEWTAPPAPMIDPANEGRAYMQNIRTGIQTLPEVLRERGYDPDAVLKEIAESNAKLDKLGIVLDCDPRNTTQAGLPRQQMQQAAPAVDPAGDPPSPEDPNAPPPGGKKNPKGNGKAATA